MDIVNYKSVIETILTLYKKEDDYAFAKGGELHEKYRDYLSSEQTELLDAARKRCDAALRHPLRHFTGGLSCFK